MREIRIPKLGMDTTECDVKVWLVKVGDRVGPGTPLLAVETEKADVVIEAEVGGWSASSASRRGRRFPWAPWSA